MTTIIGIQGESFTLICADSQISDVDDNGYATQVVTMREGTGKVQSNGRYLIGAAGDVRAINILHHAFTPPAADTQRPIMTQNSIWLKWLHLSWWL